MTGFHQCDAKDLQIVRALQKDGRLSNLDLAAQVSLSPSPCLRRAPAGGSRRNTRLYRRRRSESSRIAHHGLHSHHTGPPRPRSCGPFEARVREIDEILDCHLMTGEADYLLRVMVTDLDCLRGIRSPPPARDRWYQFHHNKPCLRHGQGITRDAIVNGCVRGQYWCPALGQAGQTKQCEEPHPLNVVRLFEASGRVIKENIHSI